MSDTFIIGSARPDDLTILPSFERQPQLCFVPRPMPIWPMMTWSPPRSISRRSLSGWSLTRLTIRSPKCSRLWGNI